MIDQFGLSTQEVPGLEIFAWLNQFLRFCYFFIPEYLVLFAFSLFVLTVVKVINKVTKPKMKSRRSILGIVLIFLIWVLYALFSLYNLGIFFLLVGINSENFYQAIMLLVPFICMFFVLVHFKRKKFPFSKRKLLNYVIMWGLYATISFIIYFLSPLGTILMEWNLIYIAVSFLAVIISTDGGRKLK